MNIFVHCEMILMWIAKNSIKKPTSKCVLFFLMTKMTSLFCVELCTHTNKCTRDKLYVIEMYPSICETINNQVVGKYLTDLPIMDQTRERENDSCHLNHFPHTI